MSGALDPRVVRGMARQLELRRERLVRGERPIGWKVGFWSRAARARLGTDQPLVGFLTDGGALASGARCSLAGWTKPVLEPEVAAHVGRDVAADAAHDEVVSALAGIGAAIELADVDGPDDDPEAILAGNVFHRHVVLGPVAGGRRSVEDVTALVLVDGEEAAATGDATELTGELVETVRSVAETLGAVGERLRAGDVVITGSVVPPLAVQPGQSVVVELAPLGSLAVELVS